MEKKLSIVIPCYNEANNLQQLIEQCINSLCINNIEVILVDNGSTDGTKDIFNKNILRHPLLKTYRLEENRGYGGGILFGLSKASGNYLGWTHADHQTDPNDVIKAFQLLKISSGLVKGRRINRPYKDKIFTICMAVFESIIFRRVLWEINAQPTIFSKDFFYSLENPPNDFSLDLYIYVMAKQYNLKIQKFDVLFPNRLHGKSSWNTGFGAKMNLIYRTIGYSFKLKNSLVKSSH
jgi:glycosyltransferase involved in cell wall biosynthesis